MSKRGYTKIFVVKMIETGEVKCLPSKPMKGSTVYEFLYKVNKPFNPYYVSRIKNYHKNKGDKK